MYFQAAADQGLFLAMRTSVGQRVSLLTLV
jgi:hypothetical protein